MYPFSNVVEKIAAGQNIPRIGGLWGSARALFLSHLFKKTGQTLFVITPTDEAAELLLTDLRFFSSWVSPPPLVFSFPFWEILPYDAISPHAGIIHERMISCRALLDGERGIFVVPVHSLMQRPMSIDLLIEGLLKVQTGMQIERDSLLSHLVSIGFEPADIVTTRGTFSPRGGIVDLFSPGEDSPVRLEFFGDVIESIRAFDPETQRSVARRDSALILPAREVSSPQTSLFHYVPEGAIIVLDEFKEISRNAAEYWNQIWNTYTEVSSQREEGVSEPHEIYISAEDVLQSCGSFKSRIEMDPLSLEGSSNVTIKSASDLFLEAIRDPSPLQAVAGKLDILRKSFTVLLVSPTEGQAERFRDILGEYNVPASIRRPEEMTPLVFSPGDRQILPVLIISGNVSSGFLSPDTSLLIISEEEIFGKRTKRRPPPKKKSRSLFTSIQDIKPGDYVVHISHGVGQYTGLSRKAFSGGEGDFLCLRYAAGDSVYVPVDKMELIQKYIGVEDHAPHVDKLQGSGWEKTKKRVQKAVDEIATDLVDLYASREILEGHAFSHDSHILKEFEASFEYEETPDQLAAIADMKRDMESQKPMDRLICGDVGYGKTEVAIRAACKAVLDVKQAAVLVPTTLLAQQHYQTFSQRFASFPVRVEMLSRFRSPKEQTSIISALADGSVDVIIGTQRLLQKDIDFRNLGLVIVDEEQRFGVAQKERLKQIRKTIDVLTLSATPIPRTLQMSLFGIRDLSTIETPPVDRLSIRTLIAPFEKRIIRDAVMREFARGGQVFFVHNRVESIDKMAVFLQDLIPEALIGVAHGQMREDRLEDVMIKFINGETNLLVCSSIIESGLDIPSANTIIINRADRFGLADLYQLRGRVGRSGHQAYAYMLVPGEETLSQDAKKRIRAIQELSDLGAGFRLAMKDLEIRGAGNLLGRKQSGNIMAVGFELYGQMLGEAVKRLQGEKVEEEINPTINLRVSAFIPEDYIEDPSQRLAFYKRLAAVREENALTSLKEEMFDRYGLLPFQAENLFKVMETKFLARASYVSKIEAGEDGIYFTIDPRAKISGDIIKVLFSLFRTRVRLVSEYTFFLAISSLEKGDVRDVDALFSEIINCLKAVEGCV